MLKPLKRKLVMFPVLTEKCSLTFFCIIFHKIYKHNTTFKASGCYFNTADFTEK